MGGLIGKAAPHHWARLVWAGLMRWTWGARQFGSTVTRSFGVWEWFAVSVCMVAVIAVMGVAHWRAQLRSLEREYAFQKASSSDLIAVDVSPSEETKQRLEDFEKTLGPHEEIPQALGDLLRLAEDEGLTIRRGEYRPDEDNFGNFMRYRIHMPIKGTAEEIHRFIGSALKTQRNLALESIQLKRETLRTEELEANIQWVLFSHLPSTDHARVEVLP